MVQEHHDESQTQGVGEREINEVLREFKASEHKVKNLA